MLEQYGAGSAAAKDLIKAIAERHRAEIAGIGTKIHMPKKREKKVNLAKIAKRKGQVGKMSIEEFASLISYLQSMKK